jgi:hypothetical protein
MGETVGEIIKRLAKTDNYLKERLTVSDGFIEFVKNFMPRYYELFAEKEEAYQTVLSFCPPHNDGDTTMDDIYENENKCFACGKPYSDHPRCPECGYTECDAKYWGDHHLCKGEIPCTQNQ